MAVEWHPKQDLDAIGGTKSRLPKRAERVADAIRNELSVLLLQHTRDPKLRDVSFNRVDLSDDLRHTKIFYTAQLKSIIGKVFLMKYYLVMIWKEENLIPIFT